MVRSLSGCNAKWVDSLANPLRVNYSSNRGLCIPSAPVGFSPKQLGSSMQKTHSFIFKNRSRKKKKKTTIYPSRGSSHGIAIPSEYRSWYGVTSSFNPASSWCSWRAYLIALSRVNFVRRVDATTNTKREEGGMVKHARRMI